MWAAALGRERPHRGDREQQGGRMCAVAAAAAAAITALCGIPRRRDRQRRRTRRRRRTSPSPLSPPPQSPLLLSGAAPCGRAVPLHALPSSHSPLGCATHAGARARGRAPRRLAAIAPDPRRGGSAPACHQCTRPHWPPCTPPPLTVRGRRRPLASLLVSRDGAAQAAHKRGRLAGGHGVPMRHPAGGAAAGGSKPHGGVAALQVGSQPPATPRRGDAISRRGAGDAPPRRHTAPLHLCTARRSPPATPRGWQPPPPDHAKPRVAEVAAAPSPHTVGRGGGGGGACACRGAPSKGN